MDRGQVLELGYILSSAILSVSLKDGIGIGIYPIAIVQSNQVKQKVSEWDIY